MASPMATPTPTALMRVLHMTSVVGDGGGTDTAAPANAAAQGIGAMAPHALHQAAAGTTMSGRW